MACSRDILGAGGAGGGGGGGGAATSAAAGGDKIGNLSSTLQAGEGHFFDIFDER